MALNPTTPANRPATSSSTSPANALSANRAVLASRSAADDDGDGGFAAQLQRAEAPPERTADPDDATKARSSPGDKPGDKTEATATGDKPASAASAADSPAAPPTVDPNALQWMQQQLAAAGVATARPVASTAMSADLAKGIEALRKGALGGKDAKGVVTDPTTFASAATAGAAKAGAGKDVGAGSDAPAGLGQGLGAGNSATDTRDSLAALLPGADATVPVQAGAVGANPDAPLAANAQAAQSSAPAQATLAMPPQSPAFAPALGHQIEVWMRDGIQHAEVQLTPQELGPIRVQIAVDGTDTRVALHADVASTRDALQQALPQLSDALGQAGLTLTGGGVSDQSTSQSQGQFASGDDGSGRGGAREARGGADDGLGALAGTARPPSTPRGLVDAYA